MGGITSSTMLCQTDAIAHGKEVEPEFMPTHRSEKDACARIPNMRCREMNACHTDDFEGDGEEVDFPLIEGESEDEVKFDCVPSPVEPPVATYGEPFIELEPIRIAADPVLGLH
eukprot:TRINITY_DN13786_c0_g1_i1.p2 TRINITY_DN13786_c0_g1~~TRINITY_DN13786_c0_g1_i1.p2  ORF type:complete len:114 (-),score=17.92 TRINITY_DN13786_c0_g1_i1:58-399(-)